MDQEKKDQRLFQKELFKDIITIFAFGASVFCLGFVVGLFF